MEKHVRFGLLATSALHMLFAGIWWMSTSRFQPLPSDLPEKQVMEVQLRDTREDSRGDSKEAASEVTLAESPPLANASNEHAVAISDAVVSPTSSSPPPLVLPAQDPPYIPAGELDVRPRPVAPVIIPFPDGTLHKNKVVGVLVLYVDATGQVDRVEIDESDLPPLLEKAAVETFLQARMHPGVKDGKAARARMKILVEFEAQ